MESDPAQAGTEDEFMAEIDRMTEAGELEAAVTQNVSGEVHCTYCHDTGWVSLRRVTHDFGATYDEWAAPCTLCEEGNAVEACQRTGIDRRHGAGKPKENPWRAKSVDTAYQMTEVVTSHCAACGPRVLTFDEYLGSDVGSSDANAHDLQQMLAGRSARRSRPEDTPQPLGQPQPPTPRPVPGRGAHRPATGPGRFAAAAADSIAGDPDPQEEP